MQRFGLVVFGCVLGVVLAEGLARWMDGGAMPHLNLYVPDEALGVTLEPDADQWISVASNHPTLVTTESHGLRGPAWPERTDDEVLVLGDSQVFGLGVDDDQTTPAQLASVTGRVVRNGGVPTYGPAEYVMLADRLLAQRPARDVVIVFNMSNDLFELDRPNVGRHAVWDGWAVRTETAPATTTWFPGRSWLYRRSHLFFALRRAWHQAVEGPRMGVPSEGGWTDVVAALDVTRAALDKQQAEAQASERARAEAYREAADDLPKLGDDDLAALYRNLPDSQAGNQDLMLQASLRGANPGDIVHDRYAESSRSIEVTAAHLLKGASLRLGLAHRLRKWAEAHRDTDQARHILKRLGVEGPARDTLAELSALAGDTLEPTPFEVWVTEADAMARRHGATLTIAVLPLDVQVSADEWSKYGVEPIDLSGTRPLLDDVVAAAQRRGVRAVNLLPALQGAQPGAFLHGDLHLTPKGHGVVAQTLAPTLTERGTGQPALPVGRSRRPLPVEFDTELEVRVAGSTANHCETVRVREWLRVRCLPGRPGGMPTGLRVASGPTEASGRWNRDAFELVTPLLPGRDADVVFAFPDRPQTLQVRWRGEEVALAFVTGGSGPFDATVELLGDTVSGAAMSCAAADDPASCLDGVGDARPPCEAPQVSAGAAGWCAVDCAVTPCAWGVCTAWRGVAACL